MTYSSSSQRTVTPLADCSSVRGRRRAGFHWLGGSYWTLLGLLALNCSLTESEYSPNESDQSTIGTEAFRTEAAATESASDAEDNAVNPTTIVESVQTNPSSETPVETSSETPAEELPLDSENNSPACTGNDCTTLPPITVTISCDDGTKNGDESDTDCGGSCDRVCLAGQTCLSSDDCDTQLLCTEETGLCAIVSCEDLALNGEETGVDCGGSDCPRCTVDQGCGEASDCESQVCSSASLCIAATCSDGVLNQGEPQIDCGGGPCSLCIDASSCSDSSQCASNNCEAGRCIAAPTCQDGLQNGNESGVDCGGADSGCNACAPGNTCIADSDCSSGACQDGSCCGGSNADCTRCAARISTDSCSNAQTNGQCEAFLQCLRDNSNVCINRFSSGCALEPSDPCYHNNFGGEGGQGVQKANQVLVNASCSL